MVILIFKKIMVIGILFLFIFTSITYNLGGKVTNIKQIRLPLSQEEYELAFWKFDEGSGNIAYDSSRSDFDGTIYGASWTNGHSNYALDFDGENDYVSIDDYAKNSLGINKTDDMILSLYFKSSQTDKGIMYSVSHGEYNPGIHIALNPNGTLQFRVWYLSCGFLVTSEGVYNDNEWHFVEIYYNGVSANPIIKIYVDNELDTTFEHYVCGFTANQFDKAKIGARSNDSKYFFDGLIDEIKIIKFPGGNQQNPPVIEGPDEGIPNQEYEFSFVTNDPEEDQIWLYVDWNDGNVEDWFGPYDSGEEVILTHSWEEGGSYDIKAKSMDIWDDGPPSYHEMRIGNQAPDKPIISGPHDGEIDEILQYTFITNDYEKNDIELYIDWDDGQVEDWIGPFESGEHVVINHSWNEKNIYEIKAKARDSLLEGGWTDPFEVIIGNEPPDITSITGPGQGKIGEELSFKFLATDPDGDNIWYWISWGDGGTLEDFGPYNSGTEIELSHTWNGQDDYIIEAWARDELGAIGEKGTLRITVPKNNPANFNLKIINWIFSRLTHSLFFVKEFLIQIAL